MKKVFGIIGWSGSGKTDLTSRVIEFFKKKKLMFHRSNILIIISKLIKKEKTVLNIFSQVQMR